MNPSSKSQEKYEVSPSPVFDPFPEPRAYPSGWDLSSFLPASNQPAVPESDTPAES